MQNRLLVLVLSLVLLVLPVSAQGGNQFGLDSSVTLEPFVSQVFGIQGLRPQEWAATSTPGIYLRQRDALDTTALIVQAGEVPQEDFISRLQQQFALDAAPEVIDTLETDYFEWDIYRLQRTQGQATFEIDIALGTHEDLTALVMMQTSQIFYEQLHAELFEPVVSSVTPIRLYEDPEERFAVPVPATWTLVENDTYGELISSDETVHIYVTAVETDDEVAAMVAFWQLIDPEYAAEFYDNGVTEPEAIGDLDKVVIVDFIAKDELFGAQQGVARTYKGVSYLILLDASPEAIRDNDTAISIVDSNFVIKDLLEDQAETAASEGDS